MELVRLGADPPRLLLDGAVAVLDAARDNDFPWHPTITRSALRGWMTHGWDGDPASWSVAVDGGRVVGVLQVGRPRWDNHHLGHLDVTVAPQRRRRGIGRWLAGAGVERARAEGRTMLMADAWDLPTVEAFCATLGLERVHRQVERGLQPDRLDRAVLARIGREAADRAAGYDLVRMPDGVPERLLEPMAALTAMINDAPVGGADIEDEVFPAERIRAFEAAQAGCGRRMYRLVAVHRGSGEPAGHTMVGVEGDQPWFGWQFDTSVARAHRGHRLGLLLKTGMLDWLAEVEPQLATILTWNAEDNAHMIAVNEALGCRVTGTASLWQRPLAPEPGSTRPLQDCATPTS